MCVIHSSLYFLWTTIFEGRGLASATDKSTHVPVPCSQHCNSISHKASYSADQNFLTTKNPPTHSTPTQLGLEDTTVCLHVQPIYNSHVEWQLCIYSYKPKAESQVLQHTEYFILIWVRIILGSSAWYVLHGNFCAFEGLRLFLHCW
jgi:hypothetical protein